jgi:hypothetical protein
MICLTYSILYIMKINELIIFDAAQNDHVRFNLCRILLIMIFKLLCFYFLMYV